MERRPIMRLAGCVIFACMLSFYACDKAKVDVEVSSATIALDDIVVQDGTTAMSKSRKSDTLNYFNVSQTIYLSQIEDFTEEVLKHQSKITDVRVGTAAITIIADDDETGTVVEDFVLEAVGAATLNIPHYELGTAYNPENVPSFAAAFLLKLFQASSVEIKVSGKTDVTSGKKLKAKIEMEDMVFVVGLLN